MNVRPSRITELHSFGELSDIRAVNEKIRQSKRRLPIAGALRLADNVLGFGA